MEIKKSTVTMEIKEITVTETLKVFGFLKSLFMYTERFRQTQRGEKIHSCYICKREFNDGEKFGLVWTDKGNKTACNECIDKIINEEDEADALE
jgi:hypothetical protein